MKNLIRKLMISALFLSVFNGPLTGLTHTVKLGETLTSISRMYGISISQIKDANKLSSDMIFEGQRLTIPSSSSGNGELYVVKRGETLSGLARRFETSVSEIKRANGLSSDFIREGQSLVIPGRYPPPSHNISSQRPPVNLNIVVPPEEKTPRPIVINMSIVFPEPSIGSVESIDTLVEIQNVNQVLSASGTELIKSILNTAISYLGSPYIYGATGDGGFDCSGFVFRVYADNGIELPRTVTDMESAGIEAPKDALMPGDILIFEDPKHVGIYIGSGRFIHSPSYRNRGVIISSLERESYSTRFIKARRIVF